MQDAGIELPPFPGNVLIIGDTHMPFTLHDYLSFCARTRDKFKCEIVFHAGDLVDNHAMSYHEMDPDGWSAGKEMEQAMRQLERWFDEFPEVRGCYGNHDRIPARKAMSLGLSAQVVKSFPELWNFPDGWQWNVSYTMNEVEYVHGEGNGGNTPALLRAKNQMFSVVSGHIHTASGVWYHKGKTKSVFGLNVGCGIDPRAYAMAYAKHNSKSIQHGCGVVLDGGRIPLFVEMK